MWISWLVMLRQTADEADDCVCYREIKDEEDTMKLQRDIDWLGSRARKWGMRFQPVKMQYNAADKKTDQQDPCFMYLRGNWPWKCWKH